MSYYSRLSLLTLLLLATMIWCGEAAAAGLKLTWADNSINEDGFKIERKEGQAGTFAQITTAGANVSSYTDSGLTEGTTYCYRLRAFNAAGDSVYSNEDCGTTLNPLAGGLAFVTQPGNGTAGQGLSVQPVIEVRDASGNTITIDPDSGVTETVTFAFKAGTNNEGATLSGTTTASINWATGQGHFTDLSINLAGSYELTATTNFDAFTADSTIFSVTGASSPLTSLILAVPSSITANGTSTSIITVQLKDSNGNDLTLGGDIVMLATTLGTLSLVTDSGNGAYTATLTSTTTTGTATVTGTVDGQAITDNVTVSFTAPPPVGPQLDLTITNNPDPVQAGSQITYTLTYSNSGNADEAAFGATLTDTLASDTTFISASDGGTEAGGVVTWLLGDLTPGASGTRTLVVQANSPLSNGTLLINSATLADVQGDTATASLTTSVQSAPVLSLSISDSPDPSEAGGQITYNLDYGNSSTASETAFEVTLTTALPSNVTFVTASLGGTVDSSGALVTWLLGDLTPGASGTRTLVVQANSPLPNGTLLTNRATLADIQGNTATANQTTSVQSAPVLSLSISDSPDPVEAGGQITYTLSFANSSIANETALGVTLTDTLPANATFVSASDGGILDSTGNLVTWSLGDLPPGASGTRTLVVRVDSPLPNGILVTNSATLGDVQGDSATTSLTTSVQSAPVLSLSISDSPDPVEAGGQITYTLSFSNSSRANETALDVMLTDTLPPNATFISASDGGILDSTGNLVTWSLGDLPPGASGTRTLIVETDPSLSNGTLLTNNATLEDNQGDTATSSQSSTVQNLPVLSLSHSQEPHPLFPGDNLTITLSYSNPSTVKTAFGVMLTYTLSGTSTFVSASDGGVADSSGTLVSWLLGDLPPGASGTRSLVLQLDSSLSDGTLFTVNATLQDSDGHSATLSITTPIGSNETVGGTAEVTSPSSTIGGSTIVFLTTFQSSDPTASQDPGTDPLVNTQYSLATEEQTQLFQETLSEPTSITLTQESEPQTIEGQGTYANESMIQYCETFLTLYASDSPDPAAPGDLVTYTLTFTNSSVSQNATDVILKNVLPSGMTFVTASEGGTEAGGVVIWELGDLPPGTVGSRSVVAEVDAFSSSGFVLTNNNAYLESNGEQCARANEFTALEAISNESTGLEVAPNGAIILEEVPEVDDDADGFANHYEVECGSDPLDPSSTCFTLHLDQTFVTVQRGSEATITASVERNFNFSGPISFSTADDINLDLWLLPDLSTVLSNTNESVSTPITIKTTNETPLGLHEKTIIATSGGMTTQMTFTLEVVE